MYFKFFNCNTIFKKIYILLTSHLLCLYFLQIVILVVDSTDRERITLNKEELHRMLAHEVTTRGHCSAEGINGQKIPSILYTCFAFLGATPISLI